MRWTKRCIDLVVSGVGLLLVSPILFVIAVLIKRHDGGPVFFRQERIGFRGRPFFIWKFRTMVVNAENMGAQLTVGRDPRITPMGHFLRKTKLDELPQLLNVLAGEMSLVGPRPEVSRYVALYLPEQRAVLELPPGITDMASIQFLDENLILEQAEDPERCYIDTVMPEKLRINLEYARNASIWADFRVIMTTISKLFR